VLLDGGKIAEVQATAEGACYDEESLLRLLRLGAHRLRADLRGASGGGRAVSRKLGGGKLVIATHNAGKLREIAALLAPYGLECISPDRSACPSLPRPAARSSTTRCSRRARRPRARACPRWPTTAGCRWPALDGRPGVWTADWAERHWFEGEPGRDWYMAMGKVEGMLQAKGPDARANAWFSCVLALAWPDGEQAVYEGSATAR
jgi:XTP/dITP diphosphohydrolase